MENRVVVINPIHLSNRANEDGVSISNGVNLKMVARGRCKDDGLKIRLPAD